MDSLLIHTFLVGMSVILLYWWLTRNFNHWRKRGINGPKPTIGFGTILDKMFTPMPELEVQWHRQFGNIYGLFLGNEPMLTVAEPDLIRDILIKDFHNFVDRRHLVTYHEIVNLNLFFVLGQQWKRIRAIVTPSFSNSKLKSMFPLMEECVSATVRFMHQSVGECSVEMDMKRVLGNLTMDVIARTAFATKIESNVDSSNPFLLNAREFFNLKAHRYFAAFLLPRWILRHVLKSQFNEETNQFFIGISRHIIKTRREQNIRRNDLIQLLMDAEMDSSKESTLDDQQGKRLTENEILAQCWVIFLAGYETTSTTISFCVYEMALNAAVQDRLYNEVWQATMQGTDFSFERLNKLPYLEAAIFETLRKYPPLIRLERTSASDYTLANTDITLRKGQVVEIPIYAVHHSAQNYPNPEQFEPDRFLPENKHLLKPYTFIPFGLGPRNCIGLKFALMEIKLAISMLVCNFKFDVCPKTQIPIKFNTITPFLATNFNYLKVGKRVID